MARAVRTSMAAFRQDVWDANNPLVLAKKVAPDSLRIYFDYGTDDRYIPMVHLDAGSRELDRILTEEKIPHFLQDQSLYKNRR